MTDGRSLKDWDPEDVVKNSREYMEGAFFKEIIIKIETGGIVSLFVGGEPVGLITELNLEAVVDGEIGNIKKFEVTQTKLIPSDDGEEGWTGERSFLTMEEFMDAQGSPEGENPKNLEGE